jgi:ferredoxin
MATIITSECINCGACEPECPNTAIYQGGVEWELNGQTHPAISDEIFYIVAEKCTECVGFYEQEACAAVCPVDCCVPDPDRPETEAVLIARSKVLHPDVDFGEDFPSRFRAGVGGAAEQSVASAGSEAPAGPAGTEPPAPQAVAEAAAAPAPAAVRPGNGDGAAEESVAPAGPEAPGGPAGTEPPAPQAAAGAAAAAAEAPAGGQPIDGGGLPVPPVEDWEVPLQCFRCQGGFTVPFKYLRAGTVFRCPHCEGSFVPLIQLCQGVERVLRSFHDTYTSRAAAFAERRQRELDRFTEEQRHHLEAFEQRLREVSHSVKPPGAPHKKRRSFFGFR